jgi:hypothetical protein
MGVGLTVMTTMALRCRCRRRKILAPGPLPPGRHASFHVAENDGGGFKASRPQSRKTFAAGPIPPRQAGEERDSGERTMGVAMSMPVNEIGNRKIIAAGPLPPATPAGTDRSICSRTMGSGLTNSTSTISKSRIRPKINLSLQVLCPL